MRKKAFTLIELLVVIAIIAILAAILFPVFAQAKLAAKTTASLSNMKQIGTSNQIYYADYDDSRMGRQLVDSSVCSSWKQASENYRKNQDMFTDPVNVASAFYDGFSDPVVRVGLCGATLAPLNGLHQYRRGYYWNNIFGARGGGGYWDNAGLNLSSVEAVANVGDIVEGRGMFTDIGAFSQNWNADIDSDTSWLGTANASTHLVGANLNGKYGGKAENVAFLDGHAKRQSFSAKCSAWVKMPAVPTNSPAGAADIIDPNYKTFWNFSANDIVATGSASWMEGAVEQYCESMPVINR